MLVVLGAGAVLYATVLAGLMRQWWVELDSSYGLLLAAAAGLLVYRRAHQLRALTAQPRLAGGVVAALGLMIFVAGTITGDVFILRISMPVVVAGAVLMMGGLDHLRLLAAPLALLLLAIPLPSVVVTHLTMPLQLAASTIAAGVLHVCQVPVVRDGNLLALRNVTLEVVDACSGLRSLVSLTSVAAVGIAFFPMGATRAALLLAAAAPIAIVGNGLRVAATGLLATWLGDMAARGILHEATGYVAFAAMCAALLALQVAARPRAALARA
jgi:exosortase